MGLVAAVGAGAGAVSGAVQNQVGSGQAQNQINPYLQQQTQLASQLQGVANGTGPNPALAQLNQTTQQTGQQAASTLASQRGLNAGLAARTANQTQANMNQQAAGQAATLQANQQLGALSQLNNVYGSQESASNAAQATAANIGGGNQQQTGKLIGGVLNSAGGAAQMAGGAGGGGMAMGGEVGGDTIPGTAPLAPEQGYLQTQKQPQQSSGPQSGVGQYLNNFNNSSNLSQPALGSQSGVNSTPSAPTLNASTNLGASNAPTPTNNFGAPQLTMARGGKVPVILSPGEGKLTPAQAKKVASGKADAIKEADRVKGKAKVAGDSLKNDTVPTKMEAGSIVLPRSVMMAKNPHWAAHAFVQAHLGMGKPKGKKK